MREILEEIKVLQSKDRGCVPNLRVTSSVSRGGGSHSYVARAVSSGGLKRATSWEVTILEAGEGEECPLTIGNSWGRQQARE